MPNPNSKKDVVTYDREKFEQKCGPGFSIGCYCSNSSKLNSRFANQFILYRVQKRVSSSKHAWQNFGWLILKLGFIYSSSRNEESFSFLVDSQTMVCKL